MDDSIVIREIVTAADFQQMEAIQKSAWEYTDRRMTPWELVNVLQYSGAGVFGAFDGGDKLVGHAWAVIGTMPGLSERGELAATRLQMYSHQLAVDPAYRGRGIGQALKKKQAEYADKLGIRVISWTFDPLISENAWINLTRLGGITNTFLRDFYGPDNHRFYLEWWISTNRVQKRLTAKRKPLGLGPLLAAGAEIVNATTVNAAGLPEPNNAFDISNNYTALLEIPADFPALAKQDPELAQAWRDHVANLFTIYFQQGFVVTDFTRGEDEHGRERSFYLVTHRDAGQVFANAR